MGDGQGLRCDRSPAGGVDRPPAHVLRRHRAQRRRRPRQRLAQGPIETLRVLDEHTVAYLDLVGSGAETVATCTTTGASS
jgi:hypothetical protein